MADRLILRTALGKHDHVKPLKDGSIQSDRVRLELVEFDPLPKAFRHMVRGGDLDVSEMALTTHLLAHHFRKPLTALPLPLWRRLHHSNLVCASGSTIAGPKDLEGKKVGVRAYSQTTGVWIRGILASQYGVDLNRITWVTMEDAHVAEYQDPPGVVRHTGGTSLRDLLLSGELAAIMGERDVDPNHAAACAVSQSNGLSGRSVSAAIRETRRAPVFLASAGAESSNSTATSAPTSFVMVRPSFVRRRVATGDGRRAAASSYLTQRRGLA